GEFLFALLGRRDIGPPSGARVEGDQVVQTADDQGEDENPAERHGAQFRQNVHSAPTLQLSSKFLSAPSGPRSSFAWSSKTLVKVRLFSSARTKVVKSSSVIALPWTTRDPALNVSSLSQTFSGMLV